MFETNSIIRASAGTGKTFALATRFIRLMLLDRVPPETIVALTFSRAAAQEIYAKILDRLCAAASEGTDRSGRSRAEAEWETLLDDFRHNRLPGAPEKLAAILRDPPPHDTRAFAALLRRLVDTQHLGAIATLDSFILKIVRNFPKEMGFQNAVTVLDPLDEDRAVAEAVRSALSRTDGSSRDVADAFAAVQDGACARQCLGAIGGILSQQGWRNFVLAHPACVGWTADGMCAALGVPLASECPDLSGIPFNDMRRKNTVSPEETFVNLARTYDGRANPLETTAKVRELMRHFWENPEATSYDYTYYRDFTLACGAAGAAAIRGAIRHMMNLFLRRQLQIVEAKIRLVSAVEREYGRMTRRMGKLTFADFTQYSAEEEFSTRGIALKNVEFRFDSTFGHWALDEFQDTSELQWRCLRELVQNAADEGHEDGARTVMAVGDMKQSIYTWRGASARPFEDIASWPAFEGFERDFSVSHRYGPNIAAFVNRVFGPANIRTGERIPAVCAGAVDAWQKGWRDHVSNEAADFVRVVETAGNADDETEEILAALHGEIRTLWDRHEAARSTDTVGVLVRNNDKGRKVADYLRGKGLDVVWEGLSPCGDDPVVQAVLALLRFSEHPSDTAAWETASGLIDLRAILLPACPTPAAASAAVARALTQQGLARTLKDWCAALRDSGRLAPDGLAAEKLRRLVDLAVAFEDRAAGDDGVLAFADFVAKSGQREVASSPDVIRVLTIHRSKGLGIDHVFVPLFEGKRATAALDLPAGKSPLFDDGAWVLSHLPKGVEQFNARTREAYARMRSERFAESLRTYYVALTRAKKSMTVVLPAERKTKEKSETSVESQGLLMRDLVKGAVGGVLPYECGTPPPCKVRATEAPGARRAAPWPKGGARETVERTTPSHAGGTSGQARRTFDLFGADFGAALERGLEAHAEYARIEWIDPIAPADDRERRLLESSWREAFVKPSPEATVWRERGYELFDGRRWESGQFDRVVFTGSGASRRAVIYDFKTNARGADESEDAFLRRLDALYAPQMAAYRRALGRLTGIPEDRISTRLLAGYLL